MPPQQQLPYQQQYGQPYQGSTNPWYPHPMMWWAGNTGGMFWLFGFLSLTTWIIVIIVLAALARWLWKKSDKVR